MRPLIALFLLPALLGAAGCAAGEPLTVRPPGLAVDRPLPGDLAVMLPYDVRPGVERKGASPQIEYIIPMPYVTVTAMRGNFVSSDGNYSPPYDKSDAASRFGTGAAIPAAVGEGLVSAFAGMRVFENVSRLRPLRDGSSWPLPEASSCKIACAGLAGLWNLCSSEKEGLELQRRAAAAPLPPCGARWLLRVRIVHLYSSYFQRQVTVTTSQSSGYGSYRTTQTNTNQNTVSYAPAGNAVLDCELWQIKPSPVLVWQRTVRGQAVGRANAAWLFRMLTRDALNAAVGELMKSLAADLPAIREFAEHGEVTQQASPTNATSEPN